MATIIYANGEADVVVAAGEKIQVFSNSPIQIYQQLGYPNFPSTYELLHTTAAGDTYTSDAFTNGASLNVQASAANAFYQTGTSPSVSEPVSNITGAADPFVVSGASSTQGGVAQVKGGTSSTSANAGGAAQLTGGQPGATGVGGAATVAGGAGGASSGAGGVGSVAGGAGTAGNAAGGAASTTGGAGHGSSAGGAASVVGGAGGATGVGGAAGVTGGAGGATSGDGGASNVTGGAGTNGNGNGGSVVLTGGAKNGTGVAGGVRCESIFIKQVAAPYAATTSATLTAAQLLAGIITVTQGSGGASAQQVPTGTAIQAALPADFATGDSFDVSVINLGGASEVASITVNTDVTIVGNAAIPVPASDVQSSGLFRFRKTADHVFVVYRIA